MTGVGLGEHLAEAFAALWRHRTRSVLTMLGMIIGTASIIAVLGISKAASGGITATLDSFGDQGIAIRVDGNQDDPRAAAVQYRDVRTIEAEAAPLLEHLEPSYQRTMTLRANKLSVSAFVVSDSDFYKDTLAMAEGRRFTAADVASAAHLCLLTEPLAEKLFPNGPALGNPVSLNGTRCTVVGVFAEIKGGLFNSIAGNQVLFMPFTTLHELAPGPTDGLTLYAAPGVSSGRAADAVIAVLRRLHGPRAQYRVQDNVAQFAAFTRVIDVIATALTGIGAVALLVAGIGIMNIMLVSVTERTREIGLRKAIGASRRDVALQFLLEAILLSLAGGAIGMLLGLGATVLAYRPVEALVGAAPIPYALIVAVAVGFSTLVGCAFGTYPALRAARLDPIAALRS